MDSYSTEKKGAGRVGKGRMLMERKEERKGKEKGEGIRRRVGGEVKKGEIIR